MLLRSKQHEYTARPRCRVYLVKIAVPLHPSKSTCPVVFPCGPVELEGPHSMLLKFPLAKLVQPARYSLNIV